MSKLGKTPIPLPKGVEITVGKDRKLSVKGPKGNLSLALISGIELQIERDFVTVIRKDGASNAFYGLYRALINNLVIGVSTGFEKRLRLIGVGFRAAVKGKAVDLQVGFSHPTLIPIPSDIQVAVDKSTEIIISGIDKQKVGQFAAIVRAKRPPEPYKGKGIRYIDEYVRKKAGKKAAKTG